MKERLDMLLVTKGLCDSLERAKTTIMAGLVFVYNQRVDKAGTKIDVNAAIRVKGHKTPYVGRGGLKLEKALNAFAITLTGKTMMDVGASTGGFSDCAMQHGAVKVFAVDVGYGQLDWKLRTDPRVINLERTNIRNVTLAMIGTPVDFISIDVSFISLLKIMPAVTSLIRSDGDMAVLIKPQFEAPRNQVEKGGLVKNPVVHSQVIQSIVEGMIEYGLSPRHLTYSPVKGADGNIEYLLHLKKSPMAGTVTPEIIDTIVKESHQM